MTGVCLTIDGVRCAVPPRPDIYNEFAIRTSDGWRISAIVPVPAQ